MVLDILNTIVPLLWQYHRCWWHETNFGFTQVTLNIQWQFAHLKLYYSNVHAARDYFDHKAGEAENFLFMILVSVIRDTERYLFLAAFHVWQRWILLASSQKQYRWIEIIHTTYLFHTTLSAVADRFCIHTRMSSACFFPHTLLIF